MVEWNMIVFPPHKKLKGSTLVEVLIAMAIVMFVVGLFTTIYLNVLKSSDHYRKIEAALLLDKMAFATKQSRLFLDEEIKADEFVLVKRISPYPGVSNVSRLTLKVFDKSEKLLSERNELIFTQ